MATSDEHLVQTPPSSAPLHGLLAEYGTPADLISAAHKVREAGYRNWDTFTPFPVHGIDSAMGIRMTKLPWFVLFAAMAGATTGVVLQWWTNAVDYPWIVSGKPFFSLPANIPIIFELTVLFAATTALVGMLVMNRLPHPAHPLDLKRRFARVTDDKFFLYVEARDPAFDGEETRALVDSTRPSAVEAVHEDVSTPDRLPSGFLYAFVILGAAALVPFGLVAMTRETPSRQPRLHLIADMDFQPKLKAQAENVFFADGRAMRQPVPGTVARGALEADDHFYRGLEGGALARTLPESVALTEGTMQRGRQQFGIYCAPCHGHLGDGEGMVTARAQQRGQPWVPPTNLLERTIVEQPVGQLYATITSGVRTMPAYGAQIEVEDRWAIILYLRALQAARRTDVTTLDPSERGSLK
jgi:mono/diheme cytochrome c family protein